MIAYGNSSEARGIINGILTGSILNTILLP